MSPDLNASFNHYLLAAQQGLDKAQFNVACLYFLGKGVEQNYNKAFEFFKLASDKGFIMAQVGKRKLINKQKTWTRGKRKKKKKKRST